MKRIQLSRAKGWRMPQNTVNVARGPGRNWGNPFVVGTTGVPDSATAAELFRSAVLLADWAEQCTRAEPSMLPIMFMETMPGDIPRLAAIRQHLCGKDLACWCPLDTACHADVLLELANPEGRSQ